MEQFSPSRKAMDAKLAVPIGHVQIPGRAAHGFSGLVKGLIGCARQARRTPSMDHFPLRIEAADGVGVGVGRVHLVLAVNPQEVGFPSRSAPQVSR